MRTLLNIIWLIFGGFWLWLGYVFAGIICCLLIVTIPLGVASFRMANYALWPFGRAVVPAPDAGAGSALGNVIWFVLCGWWLALGHIMTAMPPIHAIPAVVAAAPGIATYNDLPLPQPRGVVPTG